ncbi:MAG TPA: DUF4118 domain-containing protein, partial [Ilumatobacteraceae bacterium]|nr:DUF4118 domain-containing protein [Ilumatobacteraceae bacterium]
ERVVVGLTGYPSGEAAIRRAARMAGRVGGELIGVHVSVSDGLSGQNDESLAAQRKLVVELGGTVNDVVAHNTADGMATFARQEKATQIVLGASQRSRLHEIVYGSFVARLTRLVPEIDVHVIARRDDAQADEVRAPRRQPVKRRTALAWLLTVFALPLLIVVTLPFRDTFELSTELLLALTVVLVIATLGGVVVGTVAAIVASLLVNWYFVEPYYTLTIGDTENLVALVVFVAVAVTAGALVDAVSRRSLEARRAQREAEALVRATTSLALDPEPVQRLMEEIQTTFGLAGVRLDASDDGAWTTVAMAGDVTQPATATLSLSSGHQDERDEERTLELYGRPLSPDDQRLMRALADQLSLAIDNQLLAADAAEAETLADVDVVRTALLRAVSHDLRTPLASIKAMVSGLLDPSVDWTPEQTAEALVTVDEETDRLNQLVGNLLDASRLQIGALAIDIQPAHPAEIVAAAIHSISAPSGAVRVEIPPDLSTALCDSTLLERSLANIIANALRFSPPDAPVTVEAAEIGATVHIRVIDRGIGIKQEDRAKVTLPFQRFGDTPGGQGVGLGLSIAQGFVDAMDGQLTLDDTPGGGLTATITLPQGPRPQPSGGTPT